MAATAISNNALVVEVVDLPNKVTMVAPDSYTLLDLIEAAVVEVCLFVFSQVLLTLNFS